MNRLTLIPFLSLAVAGSLSAQTLLNEDFSDNERDTQNLPSSSDWTLLSSAGTGLSATSGALVFQQANPGLTTNIITYFAASGSPVALLDGQTISVNFSLSISGINATTNANTIRFGLFNSNATRVSVTSDTTAGISSSTFNNDAGYAVGFNPGGTSTAVSLNERNSASTDTGNNVNLFSGNTTVTTSLTTSSLLIGASDNTPFNVSFSITRSGSSYNLSSTINGQTISFTDSSISSTSFDEFGIQYSTVSVANGGTITLDNLNIAITAVPEPSTYAALAGLGVLGLAVARRRRVA